MLKTRFPLEIPLLWRPTLAYSIMKIKKTNKHVSQCRRVFCSRVFAGPQRSLCGRQPLLSLHVLQDIGGLLVKFKSC